MSAGQVRRRLAAILAADVAGYTRLMSADEAATVAALDAARLVFREHIEREGGRVVDMAGDSVLSVFETATGAVRAALATQKVLAEIEVSEDRRMRFRIGVHLGEVMEKPDGSIYGDGVNLAARLEGLAAPGGVCISAAVSDQVADKIDAAFADIGEHSVKNVAKPVHAFAWGGGPSPAAAPALHKGRKPTVAIGDFESKGGDDADALAAGVRDDVMTSLSNQTGLAMVSESDSADYVVSVSLQVFRQRYRANLRIRDRESGQHFAGERIDGEIADPFEAQDALAYRIYNAVRYAIYDREVDIDDQRPDLDQESEALLSKGGHLLFRADLASYLRAREVLEIVLAREPENFMALALKAVAHLAEILCGYKPITPEDGIAALETAHQAVRLNERSDYAHVALCAAHLFGESDFEAARREAERSLELNAHYSMAMHFLGNVLICDGRAEDGVAQCLKALEANPRSRDNYRIMQRIAYGHFVLERFGAAIEWAKRSDQRYPDVPRTLLILASAAAHDGDNEAAPRAAERLLARFPEFRIRDFGNWPFRNPEPGERLVEGLRLAGLPE